MSDIDNLVTWIKAKRLVEPAVLFLELHKPLSGIGHALALGLFPFLLPILGRETYASLVKSLESPEQLDVLIQRLNE